MALPKEITSSSTTLAIFSDGLSGEKKYYLANPPAKTDLPSH